MIPIHLSISGFLSYQNQTELDFTQFDLACISGPNGAGKSSLLDAITFALFGQARTRGDSVVNTRKDIETAQVTFTFAYESNTYRVQRTARKEKPSMLEFHIQTGEDQWKALTEHSIRETDARIQETLSLDYETFVNASFFLQGKADQFTQQKAADRKRILGNVLGLEVWETYRHRAADRRRAVEGQIRQIQGRLQEINAELDQEGQRKQRLKELKTQLDALSKARATQEKALDELRVSSAAVLQQQTLVANLAAQVERIQTQLSENQARLEERRTEQAAYAELLGRAKEIEAEYKTWQKLREELGSLDENAAKFHQQERQRSAPLNLIETEKARLETELKGLQEDQASLLALLSSKASQEKRLQTLQEEIARSEEQLAKQDAWEEDLAQTREALSAGEAQNSLLRTEMEVIKEKIVVMEGAEGLAACPTCGQDLTEEHRQSVIKDLNKEGKSKGDAFRANRAQREKLEARITKLEKDLAALEQLEANLQAKRVEAGQLQAHIEEITQVEEDWNKVKAPRLVEVEGALENESFAAQARQELAAIDAQLKETGYDAAKHDELRKQEQQARPIEAQMRALEQAQAASKPLEREIKGLEKQVESGEKDLATQRAEHDKAAKLLPEQGVPDLAAAERNLLDMQEQENQARIEMGAAQQEVDVLDTLRSRRQMAEQEREEQAARVSQYQALERAFGKDGVPAMLIEQALPQIETKANELLDRLSGGSMNIRFITQQKYRDSKRDDLRETLDIEISDGAGTREYEMFSGGEAFRINFAIRLALSEVLAQRAGARLQTLVIDEGFGSQDEAGRQRLVEVISQVRQDFEKILVITHIDALKEAFPNRIEVEKGPQGSTVRVI